MKKASMEKVAPLMVSEMCDQKCIEWDLQLLAGDKGLDQEIKTTEINRPGLGFAGFYEVFSAERIQLVGLTESAFLRSLAPETRLECVRKTLNFSIPCVIVTTGEPICDELRDICNERDIPLLATSRPTSSFSYDLLHYLERRLAPCMAFHGVMMDVYGMGVFIQGKSGVGKSECGLDLVERGHRLVADDVVLVRRVGKNTLIAEPSEHLGYHMEIRGIGIIDVERLFGVQAVRSQAPIQMVVTLERWDAEKEYERLGLTMRQLEMFDCKLPEYILPIEPGRNIAMLIEVAALTRRLEMQGVNVAKEFDQRIMEMLQRKSRR